MTTTDEYLQQLTDPDATMWSAPDTAGAGWDDEYATWGRVVDRMLSPVYNSFEDVLLDANFSKVSGSREAAVACFEMGKRIERASAFHRYEELTRRRAEAEVLRGIIGGGNGASAPKQQNTADARAIADYYATVGSSQVDAQVRLLEVIEESHEIMRSIQRDRKESAFEDYGEVRGLLAKRGGSALGEVIPRLNYYIGRGYTLCLSTADNTRRYHYQAVGAKDIDYREVPGLVRNIFKRAFGKRRRREHDDYDED